MTSTAISIEKVWQAQQDILDTIHQICRQHHLRYSIAYGTLIGAVRHGGFIPWDDDIDIIMPREDYNRLLNIWEQCAPADYILQTPANAPDYNQNFAKIRKNHTTFLQYDYERLRSYHKGVFVDIFPGDRVAQGKLAGTLQYILCAVNLLYSRGFPSGSGGITGKVERLLLKVPSKYHQRLRLWADKAIQKWQKNQNAPWFFPCTIRDARIYFPADLFDHMTTLSFCGKDYCCIAEYDAFLRHYYGDYMQLPPEEERVWKHHPVLIDFEHNYEELTEDYEQ